MLYDKPEFFFCWEQQNDQKLVYNNLGNFPNVQFPKGQIRPSKVPQAAIRGGGALQLCYCSGNQTLLIKQTMGPSAADLGSCRLENCIVGKLPLGKIPMGSCLLGKKHLGKYVYVRNKIFILFRRNQWEYNWENRRRFFRI